MRVALLVMSLMLLAPGAAWATSHKLVVESRKQFHDTLAAQREHVVDLEPVWNTSPRSTRVRPIER